MFRKFLNSISGGALLPTVDSLLLQLDALRVLASNASVLDVIYNFVITAKQNGIPMPHVMTLERRDEVQRDKPQEVKSHSIVR